MAIAPYMNCTPVVATPKNPAKSNTGTFFAFNAMYNSMRKIAMKNLRLPVNIPNPTAPAAIKIDPTLNETATRGTLKKKRIIGISVKQIVNVKAEKNFQMTYRDFIRGAVYNKF